MEKTYLILNQVSQDLAPLVDVRDAGGADEGCVQTRRDDRVGELAEVQLEAATAVGKTEGGREREGYLVFGLY